MKETFTAWRDAVTLHASGRYSDAISTYRQMGQLSGRMLYNMACAYIKLEDFESAIKCLSAAVIKDQYLAIAFYQRGVLYLRTQKYREAMSSLNQAKLLFRGNTYIDYKPLGLLCRLFIYEAFYNLALTYLKQDDVNMCRLLLLEAKYDVDDAQRSWLDDVIHTVQNGDYEDLIPRNVSVDKLFNPPKAVTQNLEMKPMMTDKARVVSAAEDSDRDFSRRVKDLQYQKRSAIGKMVDNIINRRNSDVGDLDLKVEPLIHASKSMTDLNNVSEAPAIIPDDLDAFLAKTTQEPDVPEFLSAPSPNSLTVPQIIVSKSAEDISTTGKTSATSPKRTLPPRSPNKLKIGQFLKNKRHSTDNDDVFDDVQPTLTMKGSQSVSDLRRLSRSSSTSSDISMSQNSEKSGERSPKRKDSIAGNNTLGGVFGDSLTAIRHGLTLSCDMFTASITPTEDDEENDDVDDDASQVSDVSSNGVSKEALDNILDNHKNKVDVGKVNQAYDDNENLNVVKSTNNVVKSTNNVVNEKNANNIDNVTNHNDDTKSADELDMNNNDSDDIKHARGSTGRQRPPPPTYAPPPLPVKIVVRF